MREGIDDPSILFDFPVDVGTGGRSSHPDEGDRLAPRDVLADGNQGSGRVVVAALESVGVLHAPPPTADLDPARGIDDAVIRGDDDRAVRRGDVDAGVVSLKELTDLAGHRADE